MSTSDEAHAECLTEMLTGIAAVAAKCLKTYGVKISERDVVDWLEAEYDSLQGNLLCEEWNNASEYMPKDRRAHCELVWRDAKEAVE